MRAGLGVGGKIGTGSSSGIERGPVGGTGLGVGSVELLGKTELQGEL